MSVSCYVHPMAVFGSVIVTGGFVVYMYEREIIKLPEISRLSQLREVQWLKKRLRRGKKDD